MKLQILALFLAATPTAFAMPISVSSEQPITNYDQLFSFNFVGLPATGAAGQLSITLNGDYSGFDIESAVVTLDVADGSLNIGDSTQANGIGSNSIGGLTLSNYSITTYHFDDTEQSWVFEISDPLLGSLLADGRLTVNVQNDSYVSPFSRVNPDFVRVSVTFNSNDIAAIPEPGTYAMMLAGLGLVGAMARRRKLAKG